MKISITNTLMFGGLALILNLFTSIGARGEMFDSPINYFEKDKVEEKKQKPEKETKTLQKDKFHKNQKKFNWNLYLNENSDEFFKEGNYIPPAPFMEALRRPTRKNILFFEKWKK